MLLHQGLDHCVYCNVELIVQEGMRVCEHCQWLEEEYQQEYEEDE